MGRLLKTTDLKNFLSALLTVEFWFWAIIMLVCDIIVVATLTEKIEAKCIPLMYILNGLNLAKGATCNPVLYSSIFAVVLDVISVSIFLLSYKKREPPQDEQQKVPKTYTI